jgi:uncharacterized membrane protein YheB (UPF0754 family)
MNYLLLALIPVISGFIGWVTNWVAIKMLFHPRKPVSILGLTIQGIFPKRQTQFAAKLGKLVSTELLSFEEIQSAITNPENLKGLMPKLETAVDHFLRNKLSEVMPMISMFIGDKTIDKIKSVLTDEIQQLFPEMIEQYVASMKNNLDLEKIVTEKVTNFSSDKLESILYQVMSKEFKFIEILGGVLGFLIGLIQIAITLLAS